MSYLMSSVIKFTDHVVRTLYSRDKKITKWKMYNESDSRTRGSIQSTFGIKYIEFRYTRVHGYRS